MPTIQTIEIKPVSFKLKRPFATAGGQKTETHNVQVRLTLSDGTHGLSEASSSIAMPTESQENLVRSLKGMIAELRGRPIEDYRNLPTLPLGFVKTATPQPFLPTRANFWPLHFLRE